MNIKQVLSSYDLENITIGVLGGHSALDICEGAKAMGFRTLVVCQKGRESTYAKYYKTRMDGEEEKGCVDEVIIVEKFGDIVLPEVQEQLRAKNTIFIQHRYFWVYCDYDAIENDFNVPIYGSREMLRLEERDVPKNQYWLLQEGGIRIPKIYEGPDAIDGPVIVKVNEATRTYERAFFVCNSPEDYKKKSDAMIEAGTINREGLEKAIIEEFIIGAQVNFNYFYSNMKGELELMGTDARRQTSMDGFLRLDAATQLDLLRSGYKPSMVETGHFSVTTKESLIGKIMDIGEKFVKVSQDHVKPGIIGPFALQGAVAAKEGREELVIFDVSMRVPGSPGTRFTPHTSYLWGVELSYGQRVAMELQDALDTGRLEELLT